MKKLNLKKIITMGLITTSILGVTSIGASANYKLSENWKHDSIGWWYVQGNSYDRGWNKIDGYWYYFNTDGYMKTGWLQEGGKWYYLGGNGQMAIGASLIDGQMSNFDNNGVWIGYATQGIFDKGATIISNFTLEQAIQKAKLNTSDFFGSTNYEITSGGYNGYPVENKIHVKDNGDKLYTYRTLGVIDKTTGEYLGYMDVYEFGSYIEYYSTGGLTFSDEPSFNEETFDKRGDWKAMNAANTTVSKTQEQLDQEEMDRMSNPEYRKGHMDEYNRLVAKYGNE